MTQLNTRKFYPAPASVTYYIGDLLIDDIFRVDFQRKINHQPVWGYDSQKYDFVAKGKELVTGNIVINYRYPGYLKIAIKKYAELRSEMEKIVNTKFGADQLPQYDPTFIKGFVASNVSQRLEILSNKLKSYQKGPTSVELINKLKQDLRRNFGTEKTTPDSIDPGAEQFKSILDYDEIYPFDMNIRYGFQNVTGGYIRKFKDCVVIGEGQTVSAAANGGDDMSSSAQPILEVYTFFAKSVEVVKSN
jgi:hypothetical protein